MEKILKFTIELRDYGGEAYDANLYPFKGYDSLDDDTKSTMLDAIQDMIVSEIFAIETKPL